MEAVILVLHLILALAIIALVMLQRSEGGGLGIGGGGGGVATPQGAAGALQKATAYCAAGFFATSLTLAALAGTHKSTSLLEGLEDQPVPAISQDIGSAQTDSEAPSQQTDKGNNNQAEPSEAPEVPISEFND